ncbi:hypothetical protein [Parerythrobacter aestuarii]|uniref:hypothetical protein n=1 Tax=Parerythrobacter aestuarii TaxID=3020909 RepID=UPI0024DE196C|nr:hypothetical protein [Parerythrobacter aestuarii]
MQDNAIILMGAGGLSLVAAIACYLKNTERFVFPIALLLIGVFLLAANVVKAELPGGVKIELQKLADNSSEAAKALTEASQRNGEAIAALNESMAASERAFAAYRIEVNKRFAALNEPEVRLPQSQQVLQSRQVAASKIREARSANELAVDKTKILEEMAKMGVGR